jgi:hypothetical protein
MKTYNNFKNQNNINIEDLDSFKDIVTRDIKNESTLEEKTILDNNIDLWLYSLRIIRRDVEFQLGSNKSKNNVLGFGYKKDQSAPSRSIDVYGDQ